VPQGSVSIPSIQIGTGGNGFFASSANSYVATAISSVIPAYFGTTGIFAGLPGSAAVPSLQIDSSPTSPSNTGFYAATGGTPSLSASVNGVSQLTLTGSAATFVNDVSVPAGTATTPGLQVGASTTGLYAPSTGQLGITAGSSSAATFTSSAITLSKPTSGTSLTLSTPLVLTSGGTGNSITVGAQTAGTPVVLNSSGVMTIGAVSSKSINTSGSVITNTTNTIISTIGTFNIFGTQTLTTTFTNETIFITGQVPLVTGSTSSASANYCSIDIIYTLNGGSNQTVRLWSTNQTSSSSNGIFYIVPINFPLVVATSGTVVTVLIQASVSTTVASSSFFEVNYSAGPTPTTAWLQLYTLVGG